MVASPPDDRDSTGWGTGWGWPSPSGESSPLPAQHQDEEEWPWGAPGRPEEPIDWTTVRWGTPKEREWPGIGEGWTVSENPPASDEDAEPSSATVEVRTSPFHSSLACILLTHALVCRRPFSQPLRNGPMML